MNPGHETEPVVLDTPMQPRELELLIALGMVRPVRRTNDGQVTEYELTHVGRCLFR